VLDVGAESCADTLTCMSSWPAELAGLVIGAKKKSSSEVPTFEDP
jgi:hypothetical protein